VKNGLIKRKRNSKVFDGIFLTVLAFQPNTASRIRSCVFEEIEMFGHRRLARGFSKLNQSKNKASFHPENKSGFDQERQMRYWQNRLGQTLCLLVCCLNSTAIAATTGATTPARPSLKVVDEAAAKFVDKNKDLENMFRSGITNAVQKQSFEEPDGTIYVQTGDIPAEWLRDSSAQVRPYLFFADSDEKVRDYLRRVIARQAAYVLSDPYANAFKENNEVWEQKYELDSLCYPLILAWTYWKVTGDQAIFTSKFNDAMKVAVDTMILEQDHEKNSKYYHKEFDGKAKSLEVTNCGMVWSGFRPSDDCCFYHFLIPSEMMAVVALRGLEQIERKIYKDDVFAAKIANLKSQIDDGIRKFGVVKDKDFGEVFAYEVDAKGNYTLMDDANIPSLLSAPYLGYVSASDPVYQNTRKLLLSKKNKNFASGSLATGIGSEHTPAGYIWPLAMVMQGLTSDDKDEIQTVMRQVLASDPGDHLLHESFNPNKATEFTRPDFGWPNALFAEFVMLKMQNKKALPVPAAVAENSK